MNLPNLQTYKDSFLDKGTRYPLNRVSISGTGLLGKIPKPPFDKSGWPWTEETNPSIYDAKTAWPKLTIVTPSYNQGEFIEQTIRAVLLQNYPNLEYIIIDGGSTDKTKAILEKYSPWLSYWHSEKDLGQGNAINQGFSLASGSYYAWINSDDYFLKETFYKVITTFTKHKIDFVYGYGFNFDIYTKRFHLQQVIPLLDYFIRLPSLIQPSCFWDARIHQPIWEELNCSLDYELWLRMVKGKSRKIIKLPLSVANVHADAKTSSPVMGKYWQQDHELICSPQAHGAVSNWKIRITFNKLYIFANRIIRLSTLILRFPVQIETKGE